VQEPEHILATISAVVLSFTGFAHVFLAHIHHMVPAVVLLFTFCFLTNGAHKTVLHKESSLAVSNKVVSMIEVVSMNGEF
jgi:hypothetical protein